MKSTTQLINEANSIIQAKDNQIYDLNRLILYLRYRNDDLVSEYAKLSSENCDLKFEITMNLRDTMKLAEKPFGNGQNSEYWKYVYDSYVFEKDVEIKNINKHIEYLKKHYKNKILILSTSLFTSILYIIYFLC